MIEKTREIVFTEAYIQSQAGKLDWREASLASPIDTFSLDFVERYIDQWNWLILSCRSKRLSEAFIRRFKDKVDWKSISRNQVLSESFIMEFQDKVDWADVSSFQNLSEEFIRKFEYRISWKDISSSQRLSEAFVREFEDKVNWFNIFWNRNLNFLESFKKEFLHKLK